MPTFGSIIKIPATDRVGVVSGSITINNNTTILVYPISTYIYLATNKDFICSSSVLYSSLMIETWNPVLIIANQELKIVDTIAKEHMELYEKFLYSVILNLDFEEKKLFTGSPISSKTDIRHSFKNDERRPFELLLRPFKKILVTLLAPVTMV